MNLARKYFKDIPLSPIVGQYVTNKINEKLDTLGISERMVYSGESDLGNDHGLGKEFKRVLRNNKDILPHDFDVEMKEAWWSHFTNKASIFYVDFSEIYPQWRDVIDSIHKCGGVAILAHPYGYGREMNAVIKTLIEHIDGIECYRSKGELTPEQIDYLLSICKGKDLYITGGSDWHGSKSGKDAPRIPRRNKTTVPTELLNRFSSKHFS
ncbi:MAG: hypothetical protein FWC00_00285 [Firmicutes bacterium]|nr:hypothetical protein [Bacillota bacterium]